MPLIINDKFELQTQEGVSSVMQREIKERANFFRDALSLVHDLDLIFLKSCGYYEMLIDELLTHIGVPNLEYVTISIKLKNLTGMVAFDDLIMSADNYRKITDARNSIAHKPEYRLEKDAHLFVDILKLKHGSDRQEKEIALRKFFIDLYKAPLYLLTGMKYSHGVNSFLIFSKTSD